MDVRRSRRHIPVGPVGGASEGVGTSLGRLGPGSGPVQLTDPPTRPAQAAPIPLLSSSKLEPHSVQQPEYESESESVGLRAPFQWKCA